MKRILFALFALMSINVFAQQKGISYQAVILNPKSLSAPGYDVANTPLANKNVCMLFAIVDATAQLEYEETVQITTDQFGMVNLMIGNGSKTNGYAANFSKIGWAAGNKRLVVSINTTGVCASYTKISDQPIMYTPYALYAENASVNDGYISTLKLADGSVTDAKVAAGINPVKVGLGNVNNTSDANKPVSIATQTALDVKVDKVTGKDLSTNDYTSAEKTKLAAIKGTNTGDQDLSSFATTAITNTALATKVDKVTGKDLSTNDYTNAEKTKLAAITGANTGDQDLSSFVTTTDATTALNLKANSSSPTLTGTPVAPTATAGTNTTQIATTAFVNEAITGNFVDLTTAQTIAGNKNFSGNIGIGNITPTEKLEVDGNVKTSGTLTTGTVTYPNTHNSTAGQVLTVNASGVVAFATVASVPNIEVTKTSVLSNPFDFGTPYIGTGLDVKTESNLGLGTGSLNDLTTGIANVAVGKNGLSKNTTGAANTAVGFNTLYSNTTGTNNTSVGTYSLYNNSTGSYNTALGNLSLISNTTGSSNSAIGEWALLNNTTGALNTAVGVNGLYKNTTGGNNTGLGFAALSNNTTGNSNTAVGRNTLLTNTTGSNITAIGFGANVAADGLTNATAIGTGASVAASNTIQLGNTSVTNTKTSGKLTAGTVTYPNAHNSTAGQVLTVAADGTANFAAAAAGGVPYTGASAAVDLGAYNLTINGMTVGWGAGSNQNNSTAIGESVLSANTTGSNNTAVGRGALGGNSTGAYNTGFGGSTLYTNTTGTSNTAIGFGARGATGDLNNITAIGNSAIAAASNTIQLGNTSVTNTKTSGTLTAGTVTYPNAHNSTAGQVLTVNASGVATFSTAATGLVWKGVWNPAGTYVGGVDVVLDNYSGSSYLKIGNGNSESSPAGDAARWQSISGAGGGIHNIGESYQGGIIFYVTSDRLHGLIAETVDQSLASTWYDAQDIISTKENHSTAGKEFVDWRLPTKNELNLLYLQRALFTGFSVAYWSSTESATSTAWYQSFASGGQDGGGYKANTNFVRSIRSF